MAAQTGSWGPVRKVRTYELVMEQMEANLLSGELRAGDQLPSERDLSAALGVSRSSLREALRVLEALGIIDIHVGRGPDSGATIREEPGPAYGKLLRLELALGRFSSADVLDTRLTLERRCAMRAARNAAADDLSDMGAILDRMDDPAIESAAFNDLDSEFHVRIADAAGNALTAHLMASLRMAIRRQMIEAYGRLDDWRTTAVRVRQEHRQILEAIRRHDPEESGRVTEAHIMNSPQISFGVRSPARD